MPAILYSFRRCPYAMRARLALKSSQITVELREVVLRDKPQHMLECSPKGTVPVLLLEDGSVIDESYDIMLWSLSRNDPKQWLTTNNQRATETAQLIEENDSSFKYWLDRYKYADRYPEHPMAYYRAKGEVFLNKLNSLLTDSPYLVSAKPTLVDMAIFPFIRQFANTDKNWFYSSSYQPLQAWLDALIESDLFNNIMLKYPAWKVNDEPVYF